MRCPSIDRLKSSHSLRLAAICLPLLLPGHALGQSALTLSSAAALQGGTTSLSLTLSSPTGAEPAALQWALVFPAADLTAVSAVAGPSANAAGKSLACRLTAGSYVCVLAGFNATVIPNGTIAVVTVTTSRTASLVPIGITAAMGSTPDGYNSPVTSLGGTVTAVGMTGLSCTPASLNSAGQATCTVSLSAPAPVLATISLSSSTDRLTVPPSVTIAAGSATATFPSTAGTLTTDHTATVTATLNGNSQSTNISLVTPPVLSSLACSPTIVAAGARTTCTVKLSKPAGTGGAVIATSSSVAALSLPASVTATAGATSATFTATASASASNQTAVVKASLNGSVKTVSVSLAPGPLLTSLRCAPTTLARGASAVCTVTLSKAAGTAGVVIKTASNVAALVVPASVTVAAGQTSATFTATAGAIASNQTAVVSAVLGGSGRMTVISLVATAQFSSLTNSTPLACFPESHQPGALGCTIQLPGALSADATYSLNSDTDRVQVPAEVRIPAGGQRARFTARVTPSDRDELAHLNISGPNLAGSVQVSLAGTRPVSLSCPGGTIQAGGWADCAIRLSGSQIPSGAVLALSSSSAGVKIPAFVTARPGQSRIRFRAYAERATRGETVEIAAQFGRTVVKSSLATLPGRAPILDVPSDIHVIPGHEVAFDVSASDPAGQVLTLSARSLPRGASFDTRTGRFAWIPGEADAGTHDAVFAATNPLNSTARAKVRIVVDSGKPVIAAVVNAASRSAQTACSPGALASIEGRWLGLDRPASDPSGSTAQLGGVRVKVNSEYVPLVYAARDRVDFLCPQLPAGTALRIAVENQSGTSTSADSTMNAAAPAFFSLDGTGTGEGWITLAGTSQAATPRDYRGLGQPVVPGDTISILATGIDPNSAPLVLRIGDFFADVRGIAPVPGNAGIFELRAVVPFGVPEGDAIPVRLDGGNTVTIAMEAGKN